MGKRGKAGSEPSPSGDSHQFTLSLLTVLFLFIVLCRTRVKPLVFTEAVPVEWPKPHENDLGQKEERITSVSGLLEISVAELKLLLVPLTDCRHSTHTVHMCWCHREYAVRKPLSIHATPLRAETPEYPIMPEARGHKAARHNRRHDAQKSYTPTRSNVEISSEEMENAAGSKREREEDGREEVSAADDPLVQLAIDLINVESLSGYEQPMAVTLKHWLEQRQWIVELQEVAPQASTVNGKVRHNVYARRPGIPATRTEGPRVLFNSHIDTVRARKCGGFMSLTLMSYLSWYGCGVGDYVLSQIAGLRLLWRGYNGVGWDVVFCIFDIMRIFRSNTGNTGGNIIMYAWKDISSTSTTVQ